MTGTRPAWGNGVFGPRSPLRYLPCAAGRRWWQIRPVRTSTTRWCGTKMEPTDVGDRGLVGGIAVWVRIYLIEPSSPPRGPDRYLV